MLSPKEYQVYEACVNRPDIKYYELAEVCQTNATMVKRILQSLYSRGILERRDKRFCPITDTTLMLHVQGAVGLIKEFCDDKKNKTILKSIYLYNPDLYKALYTFYIYGKKQEEIKIDSPSD